MTLALYARHVTRVPLLGHVFNIQLPLKFVKIDLQEAHGLACAQGLEFTEDAVMIQQQLRKPVAAQQGDEKALLDEIKALDLTVSAIVNNAGYTAPCTFNEITDFDFDLTMQINFKGPIVLVGEACLRGQGLKIFVNIASAAGMNGRCATYLRKVLAPDEKPASIMQPSGVAQSLKFLLSEQGRYLRQQNLVVH